MKNHTKVYLKFFYGGDDSAVICEACSILLNEETPANDIHHIGGRKSGGSKLIDIPEKLMALCRTHHEQCENNTINVDKQMDIHIEFAFNMNKFLVDKICRMSLEEITNTFKDNKNVK